MKWFLYFISIYFIAMGATLILYTDLTKKFILRIVTEVNVRWCAPLPVLIGILFFLSRDHTTHPGFNVLLGILLLVKGVYLLLIPQKLLHTTLQWGVLQVSNNVYRFWGIIMVILGFALFSWCR